MRAECSEQRGRCATITNRSTPFFPPLVHRWLRAGVVMLLVGTAACGPTWTGSVGAVLGKDNGNGRLFIRETPAGMGAVKAGLEVGDEVVAIEGKPVQAMTPSAVHEALAGKVGTKVRVTVKRGESTLDFVVERGPLAGT